MSIAIEALEPTARIEEAVSTHSRPSELRITDMRVATVVGHGYYPILRIDTNQGIYGLGEVRDGAHHDSAMRLKHLIVGQNPCNVDYLFRAIKSYGGDSREGGGVSGIEIALMDLVGKAYGVPCYQLLGGKYRDRVRLYGDTPAPREMTPDGYVEAVMKRKALGLDFIKFDLPPRLFEGTPGALVGRATQHQYPQYRQWYVPGSGAGARISERGVELAADICMAVRAAVGDEVSLCTDHFGEGFVTADEAIRIGRAIEPANLAWIEDPLPWTDIAGHKKVADALLTPVAAGEDLYLFDGFREAIETRAFDIIHPDMLTSGGLMETKRIAENAERFGIPTALHACCSPVGFMANVHLGAAIANLVAVEHHGLDLPFFTGLVTGMGADYMEGGYVVVPDAPGLGIDLNEEVIRAQLRDGSDYFAGTDEWNRVRVGFDRVPHD
ncbi:mandelate racemase/muconate lactonizing enzyme family protein [Aureimonas leprariae]|uniref:Mandelate racemase/muconate lactonizing enzyme family protein n=1 Tax=Plantimonas leprariae TaxID=2615207 RepID=A0A7V7PLX0_9HYPH|nr:mandelate racemase/muconate lactonizing enzyme family protein [Aureimonas leprariae]KAB0677407.1 mandelate racemase/muconate lactonizing enzyme family protein [Aureimonas leprariae]